MSPQNSNVCKVWSHSGIVMRVMLLSVSMRDLIEFTKILVKNSFSIDLILKTKKIGKSYKTMINAISLKTFQLTVSKLKLETLYFGTLELYIRVLSLEKEEPKRTLDVLFMFAIFPDLDLTAKRLKKRKRLSMREE